MKNIEKYEKEISKLVNEGKPLSCAIATVAGTKKSNTCQASEDCGECEKKCIEWMYEEYKEEILSDDEKDIVKAMCDFILRFGVRIIYILKSYIPYNKYYLGICYESDISNYRQVISTPLFMDDKFKGMEYEKKYSLEELGITCQTQKDS